MKNAKLTKKFEEICKKHGIKIQWIPSGENHANAEQETVWIREIADSGDFAVALHEAGHVMRDPDQEPLSDRAKLDADLNAWQWALELNNNDFDAAGWMRLHDSLNAYYSAVMDTAHPAHDLLARARQQVPTIRSRVSSFGAPTLASLSKRSSKPQP
jgi:hypothetical protein